MNTIFSRLKEYVDSLGISNNEFGRVIGCSSAQVTQMLTHEKNFGVDKLLKIFSGYPTLNPDWLLTGNGPMLRDNKTSERNKRSSTLITTPISPAEEAIIYKMYKEKEAKIEELNAKMLSMSEEIGRLKAQVEQQHPEISEFHPKGLDHVKNASTKKASSRDADNVTSATAR